VALGQVSLPALRFPLPLPFHQSSVFIFILILFLSGQMGGSWEPSNNVMLFWMSALYREYFNVVLHTVMLIKFASLCSACNLRHILSSKMAYVFGTHKKIYLIPFIYIACRSFLSMEHVPDCMFSLTTQLIYKTRSYITVCTKAHSQSCSHCIPSIHCCAPQCVLGKLLVAHSKKC
jgi:hypothetical protein